MVICMPNWWKYPGYGPWAYLPPPMRPGWWFGRGWCWWYLYGYPYVTPVSKEYEEKYLEELKKYITDVVLKEVDARLKELRGGKA